MKKDILTFLGFLVLAALIWYGHAMQSVRNTRVPVLISYTGKPGTIGLGGDGLPDTVVIEVRDAGSRLNAYHRTPLRLTVDLHPYIHSDKGTIHIPSDALRRSISDILQGTSRLINISPEEIRCPYFTEQEKTVPVFFAGQAVPAAEFQQVGPVTLSRSSVTLYGQDKALASIDTVYTEAVALKELSDTTLTRVALVLPKNTRAEQDSVDIRIVTERFTEKKFVLPIHVHGLPEGSHIRLFPSEAEVRVRVGMSHFAQVEPRDIKAVCTFNSYQTDKMEVELHYSNPYITAAWVYPAVVEYLIEK